MFQKNVERGATSMVAAWALVAQGRGRVVLREAWTNVLASKKRIPKKPSEEYFRI